MQTLKEFGRLFTKSDGVDGYISSETDEKCKINIFRLLKEYKNLPLTTNVTNLKLYLDITTAGINITLKGFDAAIGSFSI